MTDMTHIDAEHYGQTGRDCMTKDDIRIRCMSRSEIDTAVDWAAREGWNPGLHDAECFYAADPNGFFIGLQGETPVAMVSAVAYGNEYGFMGFYMVEPGHRESGLGVRMWEEGLSYLGTRLIGLDSVRPDLVAHKKPQFQPAYVNFRFRWVKDRQFCLSPDVMDVSEAGWEALNDYDRSVFLFSRETFLKCWISRRDTTSVAVVDEGRLRGYGVIRKCRDGFKVGPLFADDISLARKIFQALTFNVGIGESVFLDTPQANIDSVLLAREFGMNEVFRTTRMYSGQIPDLPLEKWFGITSFELG